jgi:hypothetical protein
MPKIDEITGSDDILAESLDRVDDDVQHVEEIEVPHLPLTGTQKLVCVVELILAGLLTVFVFSTLIRHIIELPGRI